MSLTNLEVNYLKSVFERHIKLHFKEKAFDVFSEANIVWINWSELERGISFPPGTIVIPILDTNDVIPSTLKIDVSFNDTFLTIWGHLPPPCGWNAADGSEALWYSNGNGSYLASWDVAGVTFDLLTLKEERDEKQRDKHGRFIARMSRRSSIGLLSVPIFNNAAAAIVDLSLKIAGMSYSLKEMTKPVNLCISHDLDQLRGDDIWTQMSRVSRMVKPLAKFKMPDFLQLKYILRNMIFPRKFFMDDLLGMHEVERRLGFRSTQYVLCGNKGRFGARTGEKHISRYLKEIPESWNIGVHYNYDTHLNQISFKKQVGSIERMVGYEIISGRAHYLRMDPFSSFPFWSKMGIKFDESLGYPDELGYRAGIAGPFKVFDIKTQKELSIISIPLVAMDSCIGDKYGDQALRKLEDMVHHLSIVGGTFTLLFHPGRFCNDEFPNTKYLYEEILLMLKKIGVKSVLPMELQ